MTTFPTTGAKPAGERCKAFWEHLITRYPDEAGYAKATKRPYRWREIPELRLVVVQYVSHDIDRAGLFIRGEKAVAPRAVEDRLRPVAGYLGKKLGQKLKPGATYFFNVSRSFPGTKGKQRDRMANWLHKSANRYELALRQAMKGLS
jgi:hypothetical protein